MCVERTMHVSLLEVQDIWVYYGHGIVISYYIMRYEISLVMHVIKLVGSLLYRNGNRIFEGNVKVNVISSGGSVQENLHTFVTHTVSVIFCSYNFIY